MNKPLHTSTLSMAIMIMEEFFIATPEFVIGGKIYGK